MSRYAEIVEDAGSLGLLLCGYAPGDGVRRYRFFRMADVPEGQTYFGPDNGLYTGLGPIEAMAFLAGYRRGKEG